MFFLIFEATVNLTVDGKVFMVYPEDVGTVNMTISLSGPRATNTTVRLTIDSMCQSHTGLNHTYYLIKL